LRHRNGCGQLQKVGLCCDLTWCSLRAHSFREFLALLSTDRSALDCGETVRAGRSGHLLEPGARRRGEIMNTHPSGDAEQVDMGMWEVRIAARTAGEGRPGARDGQLPEPKDVYVK
jgi:hypothetical protein